MNQIDLVYIYEVDTTTNRIRIGDLGENKKSIWVNVSDETLTDAKVLLRVSENDNEPAVVLFDSGKKVIIHESITE